jgi:plastocyanin
LALGLTAVGGLFAIAACGSSTGPSVSCSSKDAAASVTANSETFSPAAVTIAAGQSVCWQNNTSSEHTVTTDGGGGFDQDLPPSSTFVQNFPTAGVFPYHCEIHVGMVGTITVQ